MSEQITVEIFVKPYVAKYLEKNYGAPVDLSKNKTLRNIFRKYLSKPNFHSDTVFVNLKYANRKSVYVIISEDDFYRYGWELSLTDQVNFSSDVENIIKQRIYDHLLLMHGKIITKKMISYFGAKSRMSGWIYNYIPKDIKTFSEPFSGAMWVYTSPKLDYSHVENIIYNDYNKHMANLFACLKEHKTFLSHIENEINNGFLKTDKTGDEYKQFHKDIFYSYKHDKSETNFLDNPPTNIPDFDAGVKYAFLLTSTFNGVYPRSGGYSGIGGTNKIKLYALINKLKKK